MGTANMVISPSLLAIALKQSRKLLYKINAKIAIDASWA